MVRLKTVECLFSYYRYLKLRPSVCQPTCKALYRDDLVLSVTMHDLVTLNFATDNGICEAIVRLIQAPVKH